MEAKCTFLCQVYFSSVYCKTNWDLLKYLFKHWTQCCVPQSDSDFILGVDWWVYYRKVLPLLAQFFIGMMLFEHLWYSPVQKLYRLIDITVCTQMKWQNYYWSSNFQYKATERGSSIIWPTNGTATHFKKQPCLSEARKNPTILTSWGSPKLSSITCLIWVWMI